jgi:hypothetical protein
VTARRALVIVVALGAGAGGSLAAQQARQVQRGHFDHYTHRLLFPTCTSCHQEPAAGEGPLYPDSSACASCHDGTVQPRVDWHPPEGPRRTNLRFDHALVPLMTPAGQPEPPGCTVCHGKEGGSWMAVERVNFGRCLSCHGVRTAHLAAPDSACAVCHLPLVRAKELTRADVALFPEPPSHQEPGWVGGRGHGRAAQSAGSGGGGGGGGSCAICHAREFCLTCHVDAPERAAIQALESDPRSTAIVVHLAPPGSHGVPTFLTRHGATARRAPAGCATCHTRESCLTCHAGTPRVAAALPTRGPGRGVGVVIERRPPAFHGGEFRTRHGPMAAREPATCAGCHVRADCLACHRPDAGAGSGYHPSGFLARHPAAAYAREISCSDCHNVAGFCATCHAASGLVSAGPLRPGYHDANNFFAVGHGQAARQSLESCTACHVERDCLSCHSALGGRRFDPHGPGFDAERLRRKNPQMCTVCHGTTIPPLPR